MELMAKIYFPRQRRTNLDESLHRLQRLDELLAAHLRPALDPFLLRPLVELVAAESFQSVLLSICRGARVGGAATIAHFLQGLLERSHQIGNGLRLLLGRWRLDLPALPLRIDHPPQALAVAVGVVLGLP